MRRSAAPGSEDRTAGGLRAAFARDVRAGLLAMPKRLPPRWFYDELGSSLFEAICRLPWYRIARAETALLRQRAHAIAQRAASAATLIELGSGSGEKLALVLEGFSSAERSPHVHLVDVSGRALELSARTLERFARTRVRLHESTYLEGLSQAARASATGRRMVLFLGSNLGNFDPPDAAAFLTEIGATLVPGDFLLLGVDLVKPVEALLLAYDDPLGVTAAFNKNVLQRMNDELGASFSLERFRHEARWDAAARRVEMHLVSLERHAVDVPGAALSVSFDRGESIWTESSYKYERGDLDVLGSVAGFTPIDQWTHEDGFALTLFARS